MGHGLMDVDVARRAGAALASVPAGRSGPAATTVVPAELVIRVSVAPGPAAALEREAYAPKAVQQPQQNSRWKA